MTDEESIAALEKEHLRLKSEIQKRDKKIDKLEVENECLKKDNHIYKITRLAEILYNNLNNGYWASLVEN